MDLEEDDDFLKENETRAETAVPTESLDVPEKVNDKKIRGNRKRKIERLNNTIQASQNLHEVAVNKLRLKEKYYEQKLIVLERLVKAAENIANSLNVPIC
mgnify:CR=1